MAIRIITGTPGGGKSYYMVHYLLTNYIKWDKETDSYQLKTIINEETGEEEKRHIITNIDGLKLPHMRLDDILQLCGKTSTEFFTKDYQEKVAKKYPNIIYIIDEAQSHFPYGFKERNTLFYFEWHRHLGHDIFLMTQDWELISRGIWKLAEIEIHAIPRTITIGGFQYNVKCSGQVINKKFIRKQKKVFALYKSFNAKEVEKTTNPLVKYLILIIVFFGVMGWNTYDKLIANPLSASKERLGRTEKPKEITHISNKSGFKKPDKIASSEKPSSFNSTKEEGYEWKKINYIRANNLLRVQINGKFIPVEISPYQIRIDKTSNRINRIYALLPVEPPQKNDGASEVSATSERSGGLIRTTKKNTYLTHQSN